MKSINWNKVRFEMHGDRTSVVCIYDQRLLVVVRKLPTVQKVADSMNFRDINPLNECDYAKIPEKWEQLMNNIGLIDTDFNGIKAFCNHCMEHHPAYDMKLARVLHLSLHPEPNVMVVQNKSLTRATIRWLMIKWIENET